MFWDLEIIKNDKYFLLISHIFFLFAYIQNPKTYQYQNIRIEMIEIE